VSARTAKPLPCIWTPLPHEVPHGKEYFSRSAGSVRAVVCRLSERRGRQQVLEVDGEKAPVRPRPTGEGGGVGGVMAPATVSSGSDWITDERRSWRLIP
jgi:hypothetical protein